MIGQNWVWNVSYSNFRIYGSINFKKNEFKNRNWEIETFVEEDNTEIFRIKQDRKIKKYNYKTFAVKYWMSDAKRFYIIKKKEII